MAKLKNTPSALNAQDDAEIVKMWCEGKTIPEIAQKLSRTHSSVSNRLHRMRQAGVHIPVRRGRIDVARLNTIVAARS